MWLINTTTLELHYFLDADNAPTYAILSHCWGDREMTFKDFRKKRNCTAKGYRKIVDCCRFARDGILPKELFASFRGTWNWNDREFVEAEALDRGFAWVWIDTVCIDKRSSSELSEDINSMYQYYKAAKVCFVYLQDVDASEYSMDTRLLVLSQSRWFTRGWTLQELIAPARVLFVDVKWRYIGHKLSALLTSEPENVLQQPSMKVDIETITGIPHEILEYSEAMSRYSVAQRMSWASRRKTSRKEDLAYCLLGLFDVNMPLIYGEGHAAFRRLQREILSRYRDESIYAFSSVGYASLDEIGLDEPVSSDMLARSPADFDVSGEVVARGDDRTPVLSPHGNGWKLVFEPQLSSSVFEAAEHALLAIRLRCIETVSRSPCLLFLGYAEYGHLFRIHVESANLGCSYIANRENGAPVNESEIRSVQDWVPIDKSYSNFVHGTFAETQRCDSAPTSIRLPLNRHEFDFDEIHLSLGGDQVVPVRRF